MIGRVRVAYVSYDFREYSLLLAAALAADAGAEVLFVVPDTFVEGVAPPPGVVFAPFPTEHAAPTARQLGAVVQMHRAIRRFHADVVHPSTGTCGSTCRWR